MTCTYRFLEPEDFPQFVNLYKTKSTFMNEKQSEDEKQKYIDRLSWLFFQPNYRSAGYFINDILVATINGRFFKNTGSWYTHGKCFNLNYNTLTQVKEFATITAKLSRILTDYAEAMEIYQFYSAREISEGITFYKMQKRIMEKGQEPINVRYISFPERIYRAGDTSVLEQHSFFFKPENLVTRDTFVSLFVLKPEFREELLRIDQRP